jgi:hypothetical protein
MSVPNTFVTFNEYVDRALAHITDAELRVLLFATRHIMGWQDKVSSRTSCLSLSMFEHGFEYTDRKTGEPRRFGGCGLGRPAISRALKSLEQLGFIERAGYLQDKGQMWRLGDDPDWDRLEQRTAERNLVNRKRTANASAARMGKGVVTSDVTPREETASTDDPDDGGSNVGRYDHSNVGRYHGSNVGRTLTNTSTNTSPNTNTNISNASNSPLADTPITSALSDGKNTVAAQDASHTEVSAAADSTDTTPVKEAVTVKGDTRKSKRKAPPESSAKAPPAAAAEPSPYYKPSADERNAMFEAVCAHVFGVTDRDSIREMARGDHSRAGKIVSWLLRQNDAFAPNGSGKKVVVGLISAPAQPQHVAQFAAGYKLKHRDASLPIDIVKFTDAWRAWASEKQRAQQGRQRQQAENAQRAADAAKPRATPEELAAIKAEMEQARRQLKEGSAT